MPVKCLKSHPSGFNLIILSLAIVNFYFKKNITIHKFKRNE